MSESYPELVERLAGLYPDLPRQLVEEQVAKAIEGTQLFGEGPGTLELIEKISIENVARVAGALGGGADLHEEGPAAASASWALGGHREGVRGSVGVAARRGVELREAGEQRGARGRGHLRQDPQEFVAPMLAHPVEERLTVGAQPDGDLPAGLLAGIAYDQASGFEAIAEPARG